MIDTMACQSHMSQDSGIKVHYLMNLRKEHYTMSLRRDSCPSLSYKMLKVHRFVAND